MQGDKAIKTNMDNHINNKNVGKQNCQNNKGQESTTKTSKKMMRSLSQEKTEANIKQAKDVKKGRSIE